jgi:hypothetical protein
MRVLAPMVSVLRKWWARWRRYSRCRADNADVAEDGEGVAAEDGGLRSQRWILPPRQWVLLPVVMVSRRQRSLGVVNGGVCAANGGLRRRCVLHR